VKYLLDTNIVSDLMAGRPEILERLARIPRDSVAIPQPVVAEIEYGIARLPRSKRKERLRQRFTLVQQEMLRADWTDEVSVHFGTIKAALERRGQPIEDFDVAIAAHAIAAGARLVTSNAAHLSRVPGLQLEDWAATR
jgi:tRNA(fMet)-specific endonuclease VapC